MAEFKGTKGKWELIGNAEGADDFNQIWSLIQTDTINFDIVNENIIELDEINANAKLIAAAPELLEVLQSIENDDNKIPAAIWEMRSIAIEKATK